MDHPNRFTRYLAAIALTAGAVIFGSWFHHSPRAVAVPHTMSHVPDAYDPDWPDVHMLVMNKCAGCHRAGGTASDLTSYDAMIAAQSKEGERVIVPGAPDRSPLWTSVNWNAEARRESDAPDEPRMPEDHSQWLSAKQLQIVGRWIQNGALEYRLPDHCSIAPITEMDFPSARQCKACHPKQYDEWSRSMHHYASHSPVFEAFNLTLIERTSGTLGTFCSRCHMPIGTALGENGSRRNVHRSQISMEGVSCVVCHRMNRRHFRSNGRQVIEPGGLNDTCMYGPFESDSSHDLNSHTSKHNSYLKTSAFCGTCHDVTSPAALRLEEAYSEWQNSPAAKEGITCQQCHMGPTQGIATADNMRPLGRAAEVPGVPAHRLPLRHLSDHTFAGPDYSMLPDTEFPNKLDWMYEVDYRDTANLTPYQQKSLNDLRHGNRRHLELARQKRLELLSHAAKIEVAAPPTAHAGSKVKIRVDVTSLVAGHSFPTGFTAERQVWVSILVADPLGNIVFRSGDFDANGDLRDSHSHDVEAGKIPVDKYLLNFQNKFVALTQVGTDRSVVLAANRHLTPLNIVRPLPQIGQSTGRPTTFRIAKGSLAPLATVGRTYPVYLPKFPGDYHVDVRLNYRHLPPALLDAIGTPHLKHLIETVVIDHHQSVIQVQP